MNSSADSQLTLVSAYKEAFHFSRVWYHLGLLLNIPDSTLSTILYQNDSNHECLYETLKEWLKQTDSPPTWRELAEAVKGFDPNKAQVILYKGVQHVCVCLSVSVCTCMSVYIPPHNISTYILSLILYMQACVAVCVHMIREYFCLVELLTHTLIYS